MIGILTITYQQLGSSIIEAATHIIGQPLHHVAAISVNYDDTPATIDSNIKREIEKLDQGQGVIILTDIYGATHCNTVQRNVVKGKVNMIAGLNLPMLLRTINYRHLAINDLVAKAIDGGREGITDATTASGSPK